MVELTEKDVTMSHFASLPTSSAAAYPPRRLDAVGCIVIQKGLRVRSSTIPATVEMLRAVTLWRVLFEDMRRMHR